MSYNAEGPEYSVALASTLCRLGEISKAKGEDVKVNTVPKRETTGLYLATFCLNTLANLLKKLGLPINKVYIFCDALAHVVALCSSPTHFAPPFNRLYAEINALSYQIRD